MGDQKSSLQLSAQMSKKIQVLTYLTPLERSGRKDFT
jgi:hypothetical protein